MIRPSALAAGPSLNAEQVVQELTNKAMVKEPASGGRDDRGRDICRGALFAIHTHEGTFILV